MTEKKASVKKTAAKKTTTRMSLAEVRAAAAKVKAAKSAGKKSRSKKTPEEHMAAPVRRQSTKVKARKTIGKKIFARMTEAKAERAVEAQAAPAPFIKAPTDKKSVRFSKADLEDFRKELMYMRRHLVEKLKNDNRASFKREDESQRTEESAEAYERFFTIETSGSYQEVIYHIDEALKSIKEGTYGICKNCGGLIQKPRLQALPFAKNCIRCQALHERGK